MLYNDAHPAIRRYRMGFNISIKMTTFFGFMKSGNIETWRNAKKGLKPEPIFKSGVTGTCRNEDKEWKSMDVSISPYISKVQSHFWLKFGMVTSIYGALMLFNFCGDWGRGLGATTKLLKVSNWRKFLGSKVFSIYLKLSLAKKIFPQNHPRPKKMIKYSFFAIFLVMIS